MGDDNERKTLPPHRSATFTLKDILKGDPLSSFPKLLTALAVEEQLKVARNMFAPNALWIVGCAVVEQIHPNAHGALRSAFAEFRKQGGAKIVVFSPDPRIAATVADQARGLAVETLTARTYQEAVELRKLHDATRNKKPT